MSTVAQLIEDLKATKAVLRKNGRWQGDIQGPDGSVCLVAAACEAGQDNRSRGDAVITALEAVAPSYPRSLRGNLASLAYYNDLPSTTDADVFALIDKALAEAGGLA